MKTLFLSLLGQPRLAKASSEWTILEPVKVARNLKLAQTSSRVATTLRRRPKAPPTSNHYRSITGRLLFVLWVHLLGVRPLGVTLGVATARQSPAPHRCTLRTAAGYHTARDALPSLRGALARPAPAVAVGLRRADDRLPAALRLRNRRRDVAVRSGRPGAAGCSLQAVWRTRVQPRGADLRFHRTTASFPCPSSGTARSRASRPAVFNA